MSNSKNNFFFFKDQKSHPKNSILIRKTDISLKIMAKKFLHQFLNIFRLFRNLNLPLNNLLKNFPNLPQPKVRTVRQQNTP